MSQLEMGAGNAKLKIGIAAGLLATFGAAAYSFMGGNSDADAHQSAMPSAKAQAAVQAAAAAAPVSTLAAQATVSTESVSPAPSPSGESVAEPASSPAVAAAEPEQVAQEAPAAESHHAQGGAQPLSLDDLSSAAPESAAAAPVRQRVVHNKPVAPRRPPAAPVLSEWWKGDPSSPYAVEFVGQAQDSQALVILFSKPVNADQAAARVRLLGEDGKAVAVNLDRGNSPRVLVQNHLAPGRYTVIVDAGTKVAGPVFIQ